MNKVYRSDFDIPFMAIRGPLAPGYEKDRNGRKSLSCRALSAGSCAGLVDELEELGRPSVIQIDGALAIVNFSGITRPRMSPFSEWLGLIDLAEIVELLANDPEIDSTLIVGNSGGGSVTGVHDLREAIKLHSAVKPISSHNVGQAESSWIWAISGCDRVTCDNVSLVGGLGVFTILQDSSEFNKEMGFKEILINDGKPGDKSIKGDDFLSAVSQGLKDDWRSIILSTSEVFRADIAESRGLPRGEVDKLFNGSAWVGTEAVAVGLVDDVSSSRDAIEAARGAEVRNTDGGAKALAKENNVTEVKKEEEADVRVSASTFERLMGMITGHTVATNPPTELQSEKGWPKTEDTITPVALTPAEIKASRLEIQSRVSAVKIPDAARSVDGIGSAIEYAIAVDAVKAVKDGRKVEGMEIFTDIAARGGDVLEQIGFNPPAGFAASIEAALLAAARQPAELSGSDPALLIGNVSAESSDLAPNGGGRKMGLESGAEATTAVLKRAMGFVEKEAN